MNLSPDRSLRHDGLFVNGRWIEPASTDVIEVRCASTEEWIGSVPAAVDADVDAAVSAAKAAFEDPRGWASWPVAERARALERLADELDVRASEMARLVSVQNGMPISLSSAAEARIPQVLLRHMAGLAMAQPDETRQRHMFGGETLVRHEPQGVVAAIVPWNYPQSLAAFKYAPALAAGCTLVLKPSPETVLDACLFADAVAASGLPPGVVNVVPGGPAAGAHLVAHPGVDRVAFTGSTAAGRKIGEVCGRLLRPASLELGGKSAAVVLDDVEVDPDTMDAELFNATLANNGQTCRLSTRILVPWSRHDELVDALAGHLEALPVGDALDPVTRIGPVVSARARDRIEERIARAVSEGARVVTGGRRPPGRGRGWFLEPTLLAGVDNESSIAREEVFGPVLCVIGYDDEEAAVAMANASDYGLAGTVWTSDRERGLRIARRIRTGTFGVNRYAIDPGAPFGGIRDSGLGRELGPDAVLDFRYTKAIYA